MIQSEICNPAYWETVNYQQPADFFTRTASHGARSLGKQVFTQLVRSNLGFTQPNPSELSEAVAVEMPVDDEHIPLRAVLAVKEEGVVIDGTDEAAFQRAAHIGCTLRWYTRVPDGQTNDEGVAEYAWASTSTATFMERYEKSKGHVATSCIQANKNPLVLGKFARATSTSGKTLLMHRQFFGLSLPVPPYLAE